MNWGPKKSTKNNCFALCMMIRKLPKLKRSHDVTKKSEVRPCLNRSSTTSVPCDFTAWGRQQNFRRAVIAYRTLSAAAANLHAWQFDEVTEGTEAGRVQEGSSQFRQVGDSFLYLSAAREEEVKRGRAQCAYLPVDKSISQVRGDVLALAT